MTQDQQDIMTMRGLFWLKVEGKITLKEMQTEIDVIMGRQLDLKNLEEANK